MRSVIMVLTTSYELNVPNDSTASVSTKGILGQTYAAIDATLASGSPIGTNGVVHTKLTTELSTPEMPQKFSEIMLKRSDCNSSNDTTGGKKMGKNSPR